MIGDRELWRLDHDDVVAWTSGNRHRRARMDLWLVQNGMPPGNLLLGGSVRAVRDLLGRPRLLAATLDGARVLRRPLLADPPAGLPVTGARVGRRAATGGAARRPTNGTPA